MGKKQGSQLILSKTIGEEAHLGCAILTFLPKKDFERPTSPEGEKMKKVTLTFDEKNFNILRECLEFTQNEMEVDPEIKSQCPDLSTFNSLCKKILNGGEVTLNTDESIALIGILHELLDDKRHYGIGG